MQDVIYIALIVAFFLVAALFVKGCDLIIGPDDDALGDSTGFADDDEDIDVLDLVQEVRR
jgi:hypothetical protein